MNGLIYADSKFISHRDIKLENICINYDGTVKIIDWGYALIDNNIKTNESVGTLSYMAPEVLKKEYYYAPKIDLWSIGVIIFVYVLV